MYIMDIFHSFATTVIMTYSKQGNVKDIFLFWKHSKRNEKINETVYYPALYLVVVFDAILWFNSSKV